MYDIALSVSACVRSNTRADVAWMIHPTASNEAIAFTPGGGRIGTLANGAFDGLLADVAGRKLSTGRRVEHEVTEYESLACGLTAGSRVEFLVVPASQFPSRLWAHLLERDVVGIQIHLEGDEVTHIDVATEDQAIGSLQDHLKNAAPYSEVNQGGIITVLAPITHLVIAGQGPIAEALASQAGLLGWKVSMETRGDIVLGLTAGLSWIDAVVVMGHDVESSSRNLMSALASDAGYIGALGSRRMQEDRADWLAYRDVTDISRVNGPAGLDIGASNPAEIAVSIVAQIIAGRHRTA
jgi:xanthine dehydrogenase accessory factor